MLESQTGKLKSLIADFSEAASSLLKECDGSIFPCDVLVVSALNRSFRLIEGFRTLIEADNYECAANLVRLQMDSVLRIFGVVTCHTPHEIADQVLNGVPIRKLQHNNDGKMTDSLLVKLLSITNPWLPNVYEQYCGLIHLSEQHFQMLMAQSTKTEDGVWTFGISPGTTILSPEQKTGLVSDFVNIANAMIKLSTQWKFVREKFGTTDALIKKFSNPL